MEDFQLDLIIGEGPAAPRCGLILRSSRWSAPRPAPAFSRRHCATASAFPSGSTSMPRTSSRDREARRAGHAGQRLGGWRARDRQASRGTPPSPGAPAAPGARLCRRGRTRPSTAPPPIRRCASLDVDDRGLDALDHRYLACIAHNFGGGPVGIDTLRPPCRRPRAAIEDIVEPYLLQLGILNRTPRGRLLTAHASAIWAWRAAASGDCARPAAPGRRR